MPSSRKYETELLESLVNGLNQAGRNQALPEEYHGLNQALKCVKFVNIKL